MDGGVIWRLMVLLLLRLLFSGAIGFVIGVILHAAFPAYAFGFSFWVALGFIVGMLSGVLE